MGRPLKLIRPARFVTTIPETEKARLDLLLFSELEGRVPIGAYSDFVQEAIRHKLEWRSLEIAPGHRILAPQSTIDLLRRKLDV